MPKPQPAYTKLNPTPRSMKNHGKHRRASKAAYGDPIEPTDNSAGWPNPGGISWITWPGSTVERPKPSTIPHAGIRAGEIVGHRLWWLIHQDGIPWICSLAHRLLWKPEQIVEGNIGETVCDYGMVFGGTYAFSEPGYLDDEIADQHRWAEEFKREYFLTMGWVAYHETATLISGTIDMWGDVVEHAKGYRAQFAKLRSLDAIHGPGDLAALKSRYVTNG